MLLHNPFSKPSVEQGITVLFSSGFLIAYFGLRYHYGFEKALYQDVQILSSLHLTAITGLLFLGLLLVNLLITEPVTAAMKAYLLTSAPYTLMILLVAMPNEMRLWIPIIMPLIILKLLANNAFEAPIEQSR